MEGTQFYGLFGMILSLYRQGKLTGVGTMFYGSNSTGTGVTYIRAPGCGATEPVDLLTLGAFPNVKIIASLAGAGLPRNAKRAGG